MPTMRGPGFYSCWLAIALPGAAVPAAELEIAPVTSADYYYEGLPPERQVALGRLLFFDKILSGNRNISCATCHHPEFQTGDGLAVSIGEGAAGLGLARDTGEAASVILERVPRNAQPLFNLGAREFTTLFHDGRVEVDPDDPDSFLTPIGAGLPSGLDNVLAAQALFPVLSMDEMAGQPGENDIADAVLVQDFYTAWSLIEERIRALPAYVQLMIGAYPHVSQASDIRITDIGNAIAAFTTVEWRADRSPFDAWVRGDTDALTDAERRGLSLFYGPGGCSDCHAGAFQTDHRFHAIAMPQIGPGKGHGFDGHADFGRELVTGNPSDRYTFRTPSLRNVAHTGPWGHDGAFATLEAMVRHHLDPPVSLERYARPASLTPSRPDLNGHDFLVQARPDRRRAIAARNELEPVELADGQVQDLLAFLGALTDEASIATQADIPEAVPSGLPVAD